MASYFGKHIHISIFGSPIPQVIGVTVDGLPAGESVDLEGLQRFLHRRAPGWDTTATARKEGDIPRILCGLLEGETCGAPLTAIIENTNIRSQDYNDLCDKPRPAHADLLPRSNMWAIRMSGRRTLFWAAHSPLCIAGGICAQLLSRRGIAIGAHIRFIAQIEDKPFDPLGEQTEVLRRVQAASFPVLDPNVEEPMRAVILQAQREGDSVGGVVECMVTGLPAGVGSPMFQGLESQLAAALFAIPAVKGVEFGTGFQSRQPAGIREQRPIYFGGWGYPD